MSERRAACPLSEIELVALDLDGTLLRSDGSLSARSALALERVVGAGLQVICVTARPPRRVAELLRARPFGAVVLCSNGALLYDLETGTSVRETRLSRLHALALIEGLRAACPGVAFMIEAGLQYGCEPHYAVPLEHARDREDPALRRGDAAALCAEGVTKLIAQHPELPLAELLQVTRALAREQASVTHSGSQFVEIADARVDKGQALARLCAERGVRAERVLAMGDMPNDLAMLRWAGRSIAVANAHREVMAVVHERTASNDDDGVAQVLERWLSERPRSPGFRAARWGG